MTMISTKRKLMNAIIDTKKTLQEYVLTSPDIRLQELRDLHSLINILENLQQQMGEKQ